MDEDSRSFSRSHAQYRGMYDEGGLEKEVEGENKGDITHYWIEGFLLTWYLFLPPIFTFPSHPLVPGLR